MRMCSEVLRAFAARTVTVGWCKLERWRAKEGSGLGVKFSTAVVLMMATSSHAAATTLFSANGRYASFPVVIERTVAHILYDRSSDSVLRVETRSPTERVTGVHPSRMDDDRIIVVTASKRMDADPPSADTTIYACDVPRSVCEPIHTRSGYAVSPIETEFGLFFAASPVRVRDFHLPPFDKRPHVEQWDLYLLTDAGAVERRSNLELFNLHTLTVGNGRLAFMTSDSSRDDDRNERGATSWVYGTTFDRDTRITEGDVFDPLVTVGDWYTTGPSLANDAPLIAVRAQFDDGSRGWKRRASIAVVDYSTDRTVGVIAPEQGAELTTPAFLPGGEVSFARIEADKASIMAFDVLTRLERVLATPSLIRSGPIMNKNIL